MAAGRRVQLANMASVAFGSIGATYSLITTTTVNGRILKIDNLTNQTLFISDDAANDKLVIPAYGFVVFDMTANEDQQEPIYIGINTSFFVRHAGVAPTAGLVYLSLVYAD